MPGKRIPELTRKAIQKAYRSGGATYPQLADRFGVSEATIKRICRGIEPTPVSEIVTDAAMSGMAIAIGGVDISQYLRDTIESLSQDMTQAEPKSREGMAIAKLRYLQAYAALHPPTLENLIDQLLARPDFDPEKFVRILTERYAAKQSC